MKDLVDIYDVQTTNFVYFDIETLPCQDPSYRDDALKMVKPPASLKKPESIAKWMGENREAEADKIVAKTSFDGTKGHVCTISWAVNGGEIRAAHAYDIGAERDVLIDFFDDLDAYHHTVFAGHNIVGFDIPFLTKRAIILGVQIPQCFPRNPKPWDRKVNDTMDMWSGGGRISMDRLCKALGIAGKDGFDGSMVAGAWANGEHDRIAEYCCDDVAKTREIHKRFLSVGW